MPARHPRPGRSFELSRFVVSEIINHPILKWSTSAYVAFIATQTGWTSSSVVGLHCGALLSRKAPMLSESTRQSTLALAVACLTSLMFGLEISSIPAVLPTLERVLHADFKQLQWVMNAYTIAVTTVLMATGTLADRYGRKCVYLIAIVAFAAASLLCGLT